MLKRIQKDAAIQKIEPHAIDFAPLAKLTPQDVARAITHVVPRIPFILDGVAFEPKDISRFNGRALIFTPLVQPDGSTGLQVFHDEVRPILAGYLQTRQIASLLFPNDFPPIPGPPIPGPPNPPGTPSGQHDYPPLVGCGGITGIACGQSQQPSVPTPPLVPGTFGQVQMFDDSNYSGNWFWLAKSYMWNDLTRVSRGGFFGGDWNDEISSLAYTDTNCIYSEHINHEGSTLLIGPNMPISDLSLLGWNDRISSVWNYG